MLQQPFRVIALQHINSLINQCQKVRQLTIVLAVHCTLQLLSDCQRCNPVVAGIQQEQRTGESSKARGGHPDQLHARLSSREVKAIQTPECRMVLVLHTDIFG